MAGFCLSLAQAEIVGATGTGLGTTLPPYVFGPQTPGSRADFFLDEWPQEPWTSAASDTVSLDDAPPPESMPLPPALLPAAVILGWSILRSRRRRHV